MRISMAFVSIACVIGVGCGGSKDSSDTASPIESALATEIFNAGSNGVSTQEDAQCVANKIVSGIGEDRLIALGMSADKVGDVGDYDFTDDETDVLVDSIVDCVDLKEMLAKEMTSQFGGEGADCVAAKLDDDFVLKMMKIGIEDPNAEMPDEFFQTFLDIAAECDLPIN